MPLQLHNEIYFRAVKIKREYYMNKNHNPNFAASIRGRLF